MNNSHIVNIQLKYSNSFSVVSGRTPGLDCYELQMKAIIEDNIHKQDLKVNIIFPDFIKIVSGSYLLGMFEEISNMIGIERIKEVFSFTDNTGYDLMLLLQNELKRSAC